MTKNVIATSNNGNIYKPGTIYDTESDLLLQMCRIPNVDVLYGYVRLCFSTY